jgi:AcrR family transcriptional regulator
MEQQLTRAERRKEETRREILAAALECFAERGYHPTGIGDIAARVGIAHGTFYLYFENKRAIVEAVLADLIERIALALVNVPPEAPQTLADYQAQAAQITESLTGVLTDDPRAARFLLLQAAAVDEAMAEQVLDFYDTAAAIQSTYLQHGVDAGYFHADLDVNSAARAVNGMLFAAAMYQLRNRPAEEFTRLGETVRDIIYFGLAGERT